MEHLNPHRLPRTVEPTNYRLRLEPDIDDATFVGRLVISADVVEATDTIVLNAAELDIETSTVVVAGAPVEVANRELDAELERLTLHLVHEVAPGPLTIEFDFTGELNDKLRGFYRSTYLDEDGNEHTLATTQFESTNARRAFPCWDEPDFKATFDVTLVVKADLLAISCQSEVDSVNLDDGRRQVTFAATPVMSTYLLAFVVGRLEATEPVMAGGVPMRLIHTPGKSDMTGFALEAGTFALDWLTDYFGIPYPGDKCDMVAIPDFAFGAMENLGCVTYREILLLVDPEATTQPEQRNSVDVIAHELAHMWFGDLVTMKWWNGLWLKEAFATFMEMLVTDAFRPEWERWVDFGSSRTAAFDIDALPSTRAIEFEVTSPDDAEGMYDVLTYEKGAAVVRMLQQYLGEAEFQKGVTHYLGRHAFANTETYDLWDALEETSGQPVRAMMDTWIYQGGFPLVTATATADAGLRLTQQRFLHTPDTNAATSEMSWGIPIVLSCGRDGVRTDSRALLDATAVDVGPDTPPDWVLVNTGASGFYRVAYSPELLASLLAHLDELDPIERYGLLDDTWALVVSGDTEIRSMFGVLEHFRDEHDLTVWRRILGVLAEIAHLTADEHLPALNERVRHLLRPSYDRLGAAAIPGEGDRTKELRAALLSGMGNLGEDPGAIERARELHMSTDANPSLRAAAMGVVARHGDDADFAEILRRYKQAENPQSERRSMFALTRFPESRHMDAVLEMTINGEIRTQDGAGVIQNSMANRRHGVRAWRFTVDNWEELNNRLPDNSISRIFQGVDALSHAELGAEITRFAADHPIPQGGMSIQQYLDRLHINIALRARINIALRAALSDS